MDPGTIIAVVQIASSIISICYDYRSSAKSATREIIQITDELNSLKDVLESLLRVVESKAGNEGLNTFENLVKDGGPLLTVKDELERLKKKLEPEVGWRKVRQVLTWPLKEGEMKKALDGLERLKATLALALSADQTSLSIAIRDEVGDLTQMFQKHSTDQQRQAIHNWLAGPDPHVNHAANRKKKKDYTGEWLLFGKQFKNWLDSPNSVLWLYGIPGSGKSVLCSTVIDNLVQHCQQVPKTGIAYFYFDFNDTGKREFGALVRSLIIQLSSQLEVTPPPVLDLYKYYGNGAKAAEISHLLEVLRNLILIFHSVFLVFDALDESTECEEILDFLNAVHGWEFSRLHICVTSRQLPEIEDALAEISTEKICLNENSLNKDIIIYVAYILETDKKLAKWPAEVRLAIQAKLLDEEGGMFQWVVCQLDMLKKCMSVKAIQKATSVLPKSLDETYDRILQEIDEVNQPEAMKVLQALTVAEARLNLEQIVEILAIDLEPNIPSFDSDSRLLDSKLILHMCSSLVTVATEEESTKRIRHLHVDTPHLLAVRLSHASVADYLTQPFPAGSSKFHFTANAARQFMAQSCIAYLMNPEFANGAVAHHTQLEQRFKTFPFLEHCVTYWPDYLRRRPDDGENYLSERTKEIVQMFFSTSKMPHG